MALGWPELMLLLVLILVLFGAGRLPQVMEQLGAGVRKFRESAEAAENDGKPVASAPKAIDSTQRIHDAEEVKAPAKQAE